MKMYFFTFHKADLIIYMMTELSHIFTLRRHFLLAVFTKVNF